MRGAACEVHDAHRTTHVAPLMRLGIKGKQVLGVTSLVGAVVVVLSVLNLGNLASVSLGESQARAELLAGAIYSRAREVIVPGVDPFESLRRDPGLRSMLSASLLAKNVTFAAIADLEGKAAVHADQALEGQPLPAGGNLRTVLSEPWWTQVRAIYSGQGTESPVRGAAAARRQAVRIDPRRRLDAADSQRDDRLARRCDGDRACCAGDRRCWSRSCSRNWCCGRFTCCAAASPASAAASSACAWTSISTTSSASSARRSTPSANSCPRIARRWRARWPTSNRRSNTWRTRSASSTHAAR